MSCGVGCRYGSDLALLWLWRKLAAAPPIWPLAWERPKKTHTHTHTHTHAEMSELEGERVVHGRHSRIHKSPNSAHLLSWNPVGTGSCWGRRTRQGLWTKLHAIRHTSRKSRHATAVCWNVPEFGPFGGKEKDQEQQVWSTYKEKGELAPEAFAERSIGVLWQKHMWRGGWSTREGYDGGGKKLTAPPSYDTPKHLWASPYVPWETKLPPS